MAGTNSGFDPAVFRGKIRFVMDMGTPNDTAQVLTFVFPGSTTWDKNTDGDNVAFDPAATPTIAGARRQQVSCAVEYFDKAGNEVAFGEVAVTKLIITLLDEDYDQVKNATSVEAGGDTYDIKRRPPRLALFGVDVQTLIAEARDEN